MKLQILSTFHVFVAQGLMPDGVTNKPDKRVNFPRGMTVDASQIPAGQTADNWIEQGLAKDVSEATATIAEPTHT